MPILRRSAAEVSAYNRRLTPPRPSGTAAPPRITPEDHARATTPRSPVKYEIEAPPASRPTDIGSPGPLQPVTVTDPSPGSPTVATTTLQSGLDRKLAAGGSNRLISGFARAQRAGAQAALDYFGGRQQMPDYRNQLVAGGGLPTNGGVPVAGWQCAILSAFGLPCTQQGLVEGITQGIQELVAGNQQQTQQCQYPLVRNSAGQCVSPGSPGDLSTTGGGAVMGIFGVPAVQPQIVGEVARTSGCGGVSQIRRCPTGLVLGKDNLCYAKGSIPNKARKWPKAAKPPVSAYDAKMMRKYGPKGSKRNRIKKLAGTAGFTCKNR